MNEERTGISVKDFYEILRQSERSMGKEMKDLTLELRATTDGFKKYNGLKPMIEATNENVDKLTTVVNELTIQMGGLLEVQKTCQATSTANYNMSDRLKSWSGWGVSLVLLLLRLYEFFAK